MTRKQFRKLVTWILCYVIFFALFIVILINTKGSKDPQALPYGYRPWIIGTSKPAGEFEEIITVPVNSDSDILTKREYTGGVSIIIRGEGQLGKSYIHDAFYAYESAIGIKQALNSLYLDNHEYPSEFFVERPRYSPTHEYALLYTVGNKFRPIHFRVVNNNNDDKSEFTIEISVRNLVGGEGR